MSDSRAAAARPTPLGGLHRALGARMAPFAGYDMPVQYKGILAEARAVRSAAGIFDVSHMGRFFVDGPDARALLDWAHTADIGEEMPAGRARYGLLCNEAGGVIDDALVYRLGAERFLIVANAANAERVFGWLDGWRAERFPNASLADRTGDFAMIALQGPEAVGIAARTTGFDPAAVRAHVARHLARFKVPRYVWLQDEQLPRGATGKIQKRALRDRILSQAAELPPGPDPEA